MTVSLNTLCRFAVLAVGLALGGQASAGTATIDCGTGSPSWNSQTNTLSCGAGGGTQCSITGPNSAAVNTQFTLTANCPSGSTYTWTGGAATGCTGATCNVTETVVSTKNYTVDTESSTPSANFPVTITAGPVPAGCSLSASPTSGGPTAQNVTLTANCTSGTDPITIAWSSNASSCPTSMTIGTPAQCTINNVSANTTWTASFSNSVGQATNNPRSATYTYSAGGGGNFAGCPGGTITIDNTWGNMAIDTAEYGDFGGNILSVRFTVPATGASTSLKTTSWVEFGDGPTVREAVFSTKACDFTGANALKTSFGAAMKSLDQIRFSFLYKVGAAGSSNAGLVAGQSYYINVRNKTSAGVDTCAGTCRMRGAIQN